MVDKLEVMAQSSASILPAPQVVDCQAAAIDDLLGREWLVSNSLGAYASSSVIGCNTRRYHGLLIAATHPPVGKINALSTVIEQLDVDGHRCQLGTNEFAGAFSPAGWVHLETFTNDVAPRFVFRFGDWTLTKEVLLAEAANAVCLRYTLAGGAGTLHLRPFATMRDFHHVRPPGHDHHLAYDLTEGGAIIHDIATIRHNLHVTSPEAAFHGDPQWWYAFHYRADAARGHDEPEDAYAPGNFTCDLQDGQTCHLIASLGEPGHVLFDATLRRRQDRLANLADSVGAADDTTRRLAVATDTFVPRRDFANAEPSATIIAGFHWFADWGRDTFVALPGLLLNTKRFDIAKQVFKTFAAWIQDGLVPNCFDERADGAGYNSIDASLWFVIAAERYLAATDDQPFWQDTLMPAIASILQAYHDGTRFGIHADGNGLLTGGSPKTQLTWMDAADNDQAITPRYGKAVEINALWYAAHRIMARRCHGVDDRLAAAHHELAELIGPTFLAHFWNPNKNCLYDVITDDGFDAAIRPNQIFAVSLPYSPLPLEQQQAVVDIVRRELLTPYGLRTLSPTHPGYRGQYAGGRHTRDTAYHQGTVWPWLIGPFIEAYLKTHPGPDAATLATQWLEAFDWHLGQAGLGSISEVFDGDAPHRPEGCIGQAWSVAEVLRAKQLIADRLGQP